MGSNTEVDDKHWDELPAQLKKAATKLGYDRKLWDNDQEPDLCDLNWSALSSEQQKAARLLGYTSERWDAEVSSSGFCSTSFSPETLDSHAGGADTNSGDNDGKLLENQIKTLEGEISQRQQKLKKLLSLKSKERTAYARMLQSHEDCVNSHLQKRISCVQPDLHQHGFPALKRGPLQLIRDFFLNEYYHTLPGCISLIAHCVVYASLSSFGTKFLKDVCHHLTLYLSGWHIIDNNYDDTAEEHIFFLIAMIFSLLLVRISGLLYDFNENRIYQRRLKFHFRNRWHMGYWDMRIMNWFSGDEIADKYEGNVNKKSGLNHKGKIWGPKLKCMLDIFSFYLCYGCIEHFVIESGPKTLFSMRETVLKGLPSQQLYQQWASNLGNDEGELYCIKSGSHYNATDECLDPSMLKNEYVSDVWNWIMNSNRCGWTADDDGGGNENEDEDKDHPEKQGGASSSTSFSSTGAVVQKFQPWKQADEEWRRLINIRDDEYLRVNVSLDAYYALVGDPYADFVDPVREQLFFLAMTGISMLGLYWYGIPYTLI